MNKTDTYYRIFLVFGLAALTSCGSLSLQWVDYAWPVESVLKVSTTNTVEDGRYAVSIRVTNLSVAEFEDSAALVGVSLRLIRNEEGYYFVTGPKFKNVYVFTPGASELNLKSRIQVSETGLKSPALNQRPPFIEVVDGKGWKRLLSNDDIVEEKK